MTKIFGRFAFFFMACFALSLFSATLVAQGMSPIEVTAITVSPSTFSPGEIVTATITLKNTSRTGYRCERMQAEINAYKAAPYTLANRIWHAKQNVDPFAPGEIRNIKFESVFKVPGGLTELHYEAKSPVCPPHEFPHVKNLILGERVREPRRDPNLTVCITSGKSAPIGQTRDIHVWVKNNDHDFQVNNITVAFYIEGKGTTKETFSLAENGMKKITRTPSWRTRGTRKLSATVTVAGSSKVWTVEGFHRVILPGEAVGVTPHVRCSDGTTRTESEMK